MLVRAGTMTGDAHASPVNHFIQHAFLVECRKFAAFFKNNRGPKRDDIVAMDFVSKRFRPALPVWARWHNHMNIHLMHLAYGRVDNKTPWDGSANAPLLKEFSAVWAEFIRCLNPLYQTEFADQLRSR